MRGKGLFLILGLFLASCTSRADPLLISRDGYSFLVPDGWTVPDAEDLLDQEFSRELVPWADASVNEAARQAIATGRLTYCFPERGQPRSAVTLSRSEGDLPPRGSDIGPFCADMARDQTAPGATPSKVRGCEFVSVDDSYAIYIETDGLVERSISAIYLVQDPSGGIVFVGGMVVAENPKESLLAIASLVKSIRFE